jgi:hypothetical protein
MSWTVSLSWTWDGVFRASMNQPDGGRRVQHRSDDRRSRSALRKLKRLRWGVDGGEMTCETGQAPKSSRAPCGFR